MRDAVRIYSMLLEASHLTLRNVAPFSFVKYHGVADQLPNNFIAIGDSLMILNPIRG